MSHSTTRAVLGRARDHHLEAGMKFGNSTTSPGAKASPASGRGSKPRKLTNPSLFLLLALAGGLLGLGAGAYLMLQEVTSPALNDARQKQLQTQARSAAALVSHTMARVGQEVERVASLPMVSEALRDAGQRDALEQTLTAYFPHATEAYLIPQGAADAGVATPASLSFAALDLVRRAETGTPQPPEAFLRDEHWFVQKALAVRDSQTQEILGSLLVVFEQKLLTDALAAVQAPGGLTLLQQVSNLNRPIAQQGAGSDEESLEVPTGVPNWSLRYQAAPGTQTEINESSAWLALAVAALILLTTVSLAFVVLMRWLRQDVMALSAYAQSLMLGERPAEPAQRLNVGQPLVTAMAHYLGKPVKRGQPTVAQALNSSAGVPEVASEQPDLSAPLFQSNDALDISLLDSDEDLLGLGSSATPTAPSAATSPAIAESVAASGSDSRIPAEIFRAYDIRGIVGSTLTEETVYLIGRGLGSEAGERGFRSLCVGYDGRESSPALAAALSRGIQEAGIDVIHIGMVPTPVLYFATHHLGTGSGVMVTGSHNPAKYNGLKMMLGGETVAQDDFQALHRRIREGHFLNGQGQASEVDVRRDYLETIVGDIAVATPLKVVVDAGNGVAGELGPLLLQELGCEVVPIYCDIDGRFPNHHPDPGKPENLRDLIARVQAEGADLGIAFDGDGDRIGVVTNTGKIIWPDRLLMLFAKDVVSRNPGADVIFDVKCTRRLNAVISGYGGRPVMWKTGHSLIKAKMRETGALLAGEMSGHIFFKERWYGFDDGLYSAARLLEILGIDDRNCDEIFAALPEDLSTPELNVEVTEDSKFKIMERLARSGKFGDGNLSTIDGIRVDYAHGWGLCRASNTTPALVLRFEAETPEALAQIQDTFREQLLAVDDSLALPF